MLANPHKHWIGGVSLNYCIKVKTDTLKKDARPVQRGGFEISLLSRFLPMSLITVWTLREYRGKSQYAGRRNLADMPIRVKLHLANFIDLHVF